MNQYEYAYYIKYMKKCSDLLKISQQTFSLALTFFHKFNNHYKLKNINNQENQIKEKIIDPEIDTPLDNELLCCTCLYLACKSNEVNRKIRDVINVGYRVQHPEEKTLKIDDNFWKFCNSLVNSELILLRVLKFDVNTKLAYQYLQRFFQDYLISDFCDLKYDYKRSISLNLENVLRHLTQVSWSFINDCYLNPEICINYSHKAIAIASLYFGLKNLNIGIYKTFSQWCHELYSKINPDDVLKIIQHQINFYNNIPLNNI
ncbi:cyclin-like protein [Piromyces finnis]|uniref:Cyclin-like protein n=1 Tax=Piromyces finnis TaxID=1754191 RepID=A0A1Y1VLF0_9FUNG|nr:cyclin-like protein [Piromyces finnis]|eukprot:ORX58598.1 cyclin-like protein [Piromyces finnis]